MSRRRCILIAFALMAAVVAHADPAFYRSFDGTEKTWQLVQNDAVTRLLSHDHVTMGARSSAGAERMVVAAPAGQSAMVLCDVPHMPVLDELQARLWVKASRPGVQLALRVVLPRTADVATGRAATAIVRSSPYNQPGHGQQLALSGIPKLLANEVRVLRAVPGAAVDSREARIDAVVLIIPGEPEGVEILTDELEVDGILANPNGPSAAAKSIHAPGEQEAVTGQPGPSVRFEGSTLVVEGRPFTPRAIESCGEPLKFLAERGFNAVRIADLPTAEQTAEAREHQLWFLCTPPRPDQLARSGLHGVNSERVLAWYLADEADAADFAYSRRWAEQVRAQDAAVRPIVIAPPSQWTAQSKSADILVAEHPLGASISPHEFGAWLSQRRQLARPGTPLWLSVPTQLGKTASRQAAALSGTAGLTPNVDGDWVDTLVKITATQGCRGFIFKSRSSLAENDATTRRRAMLVEHINHQLAVWEPWLAGGKVIGRVSSLQSAGSEATVSAVVMQVDYARLLVPIDFDWTEPQFDKTTVMAPADVPTSRRVFVVPGIPDSNQVFLLSPVGLRSLEARRVAGGTSIVLEPGDNGCVLMTEDPQVIHGLRQHITRNAAKAARLQHQLAAMESTTVSATGRALAELGMTSVTAERNVASAASQLRHADRLLTSGRLEEAYQLTASARKVLHRAATEQRRAVPMPKGHTSYPLALCYDTLTEHAKFVGSLDKLRGDDNLLYGGDFEDLGNLLEFGWQHVNHPLPDVAARAELSATAPRHGSYCLQLVAHARGEAEVAAPLPRKAPVAAINASSVIQDPFRPTNFADASSPAESKLASGPPDDSHVILPNAPVWISAPAIPVERASLIEISGWIRVTKPLVGSMEGLQIIDSLGGPELSIRALETAAWEPFRMIRAVPETTELNVTFLLSGLGSAQVDGVMVRPLIAPVPRRLPPVK